MSGMGGMWFNSSPTTAPNNNPNKLVFIFSQAYLKIFQFFKKSSKKCNRKNLAQKGTNTTRTHHHHLHSGVFCYGRNYDLVLKRPFYPNSLILWTWKAKEGTSRLVSECRRCITSEVARNQSQRAWGHSAAGHVLIEHFCIFWISLFSWEFCTFCLKKMIL